MKKKAYFRKLAVGVLAAVMAVSAVLPGTAQAESEAEVRDVNLNVGGKIVGIKDPFSTGASAEYWSGNYVYFGSYNDRPILWRVLDAETAGVFGKKSTMLLQSTSVLKNMAFRQDYWADDASEWLSSDARTWLNDEVLPGFDEEEQAAVALSTKAALAEDETELDDRAFEPLKDDRLFLLDAAEAKPAYGYGTSRCRGIGNPWWNRSAVVSMSNHQGAFCPIGNSIARGVYETNKAGVVPAFNLDLSKVAFVTKGTAEKASEFTFIKGGSGISIWNLTLTSGSGFRAGWSETAGAEKSVTVEITKLASGNPQPYTQISAMLVDEQGTVVAYGKISDEIRTGDFTVTLPREVSTGRYTLKVFEEDVQGDSPHLETDYASNMANLPLTVKESGQIETETPEPEEPETETQEPETKEPETETQEPETETQEPETKEPETETQESETETQEPETKEPETETQEPETKEPETETQEPETEEPETETQEPETKEPETETQEPETKEPETETQEPETKEPETEAQEAETKVPVVNLGTGQQEPEKTETVTETPGEMQPQKDTESSEPAAKRPPRPKITKTNRTAKAFLVKWKKLPEKVNGYQIQYSTNKKFKRKKVRTVTVKRAKATQKRITGLKAGKKYYVRIRSFRTVGNRKYYSLWSRKKII